jgi:hypothetical protein
MKLKMENMRLPRSMMILVPAFTLLVAASYPTPGNHDYLTPGDLHKADPVATPATHDLDLMMMVNKDQERVDDLCNINSIRRHLAGRIRYPDNALKGSKYGTVELYVSFNSDGRVNEIQTLTPVRDYIEIQAIDIIESVPAGVEIIESSRHESLLDESKRVVMLLPRCDIQDIFGKTLKFTFNFILKPA